MYQLLVYGGLAQLARAPALHAGGHRFDSDILHMPFRGDRFIDILEQGIQRHVMLLYIPKKKETRIFIK